MAEIVPDELLAALAADAPQPEQSGREKGSGAGASSNGEYHSRVKVEDWLEARGIDYRVKREKDSKGRTVYVLKKCPFDGSHGDPDSCIMQESGGKMAAHCFHNSCTGQGWQQFKEKIGAPGPEHYDPPLPGGPTLTIGGKPAGAADAGEEPGVRVGGYRFAPLTAPQFANREYHLDWLVQSTLVRGLPVIVGGPRKSLKTTLLLDLALSLGSATPFLGTLKVYNPVRVVILSGESGPWALKETALRICTAKCIRLQETNTHWDFELPQLANPKDLLALHDGLADLEAEVAIVDPLYLALLCGAEAKGLEASNLFDMGPLLRGVAEACLSAGCTQVLSHHSVKRLQAVGEPLELEDLAFAGIQEFARQWMLINRREPFDPDAPGSHRLWLSVGGSIGVARCWGVDVEEGELRDDFTGRKWEVSLQTAGSVRTAATQRKAAEKGTAARQRDGADETALLAALDTLAPGKGEAAPLRRVQNLANLPRDRMNRALERLRASRLVEVVTVAVTVGNGAQRKAEGVRRREGRTC
jgi:replicative DNA helicase